MIQLNLLKTLAALLFSTFFVSYSTFAQATEEDDATGFYLGGSWYLVTADLFMGYEIQFDSDESWGIEAAVYPHWFSTYSIYKVYHKRYWTDALYTQHGVGICTVETKWDFESGFCGSLFWDLFPMQTGTMSLGLFRALLVAVNL